MHHFRQAALFILLVLYTWPVQGQRQFSFTSYGVDEGLPQSSVWSLLQDRRGYLWIGTADGLCRYDGTGFTRIQPAAGASAIKGMVHLYEDGGGDIWVTGQQGVLRYHPQTGQLREVYRISSVHAGELFHKILGEDAGGNLWIAISRQGLLCINRRTGAVRGPITVIPGRKPEEHSIFDGYIDQQQRLWFSNNASGLYCYDITGKKCRQVFSGTYGYAILRLSDTDLLTAFRDSLVYVNTTTLQCRVVQPLQQWQRSVPLTYILDITKDREGALWLCTPQGAYIYDERAGRIIRQFASFATGAGPVNGYSLAYTALSDRSGNMWIGTNGDGLKKLPAGTKQFLHYNHPSPAGSLVKSICLRDSIIYAGMFKNGLQLFHQRLGYLRTLQRQDMKGAPAESTVFAIAPFDSASLLLYSNGDMGMDVGLLDCRSQQYQSLSALLHRDLPGILTNGLNFPFIIQGDNKSEPLLSYCDYLLQLYRDQQGQLHFKVLHRFTGNSITCLFRDSRCLLHAGCLNGYYCQAPDGTWAYKAMHGGVYVKTISEDRAGNLWIGATTGLGIYSPQGKEIAWLTERDGLKNDFIYGILRDERGRMWASHNRGISMYDPLRRELRHYSKEDGLQSNEFNTGAYAYGAGGWLLFGGINGINAFQPDSIQSNPVAPLVQITGITLFDQPLKTYAAYDHISTITLPYDQNSLGFELAALEFTDPARNALAYRMDGVDKDWIYAGTKRSTRYPALQPGSYTFHVKAANSDGVWSPEDRQLRIRILPPFWQRGWFVGLAILVAVCMLAAAIWLLQRERYRKQLRAIALQRSIQEERERISRDLHDNVGTQLSLISNNIAWMVQPARPLPAAEQVAKLGYIGEVAHEVITTLRDTIWALSKEQITLEELGDKLKAFTGRLLSADASDIQLQFSDAGTEQILLGPSEALHLFRICQEAIANALKYAQASILRIAIINEDGSYHITISDDGEGFNPAAAGRGYGLDNMKHRAAAIGCALHIDSRLDTGTTISIRKMVQMH